MGFSVREKKEVSVSRSWWCRDLIEWMRWECVTGTSRRSTKGSKGGILESLKRNQLIAASGSLSYARFLGVLSKEQEEESIDWRLINGR